MKNVASVRPSIRLFFVACSIVVIVGPWCSWATLADEPVLISAAWTRSFQSTQSAGSPKVQLLAVGDDRVALELGDRAVVFAQTNGTTRLTASGVQSIAVSDAALIVAERRAIVAFRATDQTVLWKYACPDAPFVVTLGGRVVTQCAHHSVVLAGRTGVVTARVALPSDAGDRISDARRLNDRYLFVESWFDGAWMGSDYAIVDARTGRYLWDRTDVDVVDVGAETMSIASGPSMLPWGRLGLVEVRRLADGKIVGRRAFDLGSAVDAADRGGSVTYARRATYVTTQTGSTYRFPARSTTGATFIGQTDGSVLAAFGSAFLVLTGSGGQIDDGIPSAVVLDEPAPDGSFKQRSLGEASMNLRSVEGAGRVLRLGTAVAVGLDGALRIYDAHGTLRIRIRTQCRKALTILETRTGLVTLCTDDPHRFVVQAFTIAGDGAASATQLR